MKLDTKPVAENFAGKSLLIMVSYASGMPGFSPSEWVSDKLEVLESEQQRAVLITSSASNLVSSGRLRVIKVPSLSWRDFKIENSQTGESFSGKRGLFFLSFLAAASLGRVFDWVFKSVAGQESDGRWSWSLTASPVVIFQALRARSCKIFATGGPSSAHLASVWAGIFARRIVILEFQDPFIGSEMGLSPKVMRILYWVEKFLIGFSAKTVFVTKAAAAAASNRLPSYTQRVDSVYPGASRLVSQKICEPSPTKTVDLIHLGTLYGSRDLDTFFEALDELQRTSSGTLVAVSVNNLGAVYLPQLEEYRRRSDFKQTPLLPRRDALELAKGADCLLLVQHGDSRSEETIPYKFYDYLNLGVPIFGLVKSHELGKLLISAGGYACEQGDVASTKKELLRLMRDFQLGEQTKPLLELDITEQFRNALRC